MISNNLTIGKQAATEATTKRVALTMVTAILATEETLTAVTIVPTFLQPASSIEEEMAIFETAVRQKEANHKRNDSCPRSRNAPCVF
ncbi:hypothetical protein T08_10058 [Trichinella sp. T8]|nr:hypothetical protein T08_10058 [Trichinella sp. T8]